MFSELLQKVVEHYDDHLPFVMYRKPQSTEIKAVLQSDSQLNTVTDFTETGFVFAPFDSNRSTVLLRPDTVLKATYEPIGKSAAATESTWEDEISKKNRHLNLVEKGIARIKLGEMKKVVLSREVKMECEANPLDLFKALIASYENALCYLWHHPEIGTWLGATPEILLKVENQQFTTMSLAGTQKYVDGQSPEWGNKELEEQQMVTDYISSALQNVVSNLNIGKRESIRAGDLWHLRTKLNGRIEKGSLGRIIRVLHPTPAVCGLPMESAKSFILNSEDYDRKYYTGFIGELNFKLKRDRSSHARNQENTAYRSITNTTLLFVNLRCMQIKESFAHIYVGGGVTQYSDPKKEWFETVAKSKTMLRVLRA